MRAVVTRVKNASVTIDGAVKGAIGPGFLVLLGVHVDDTEAQADKIADKICGLRVFEDENGKMNKSLIDVNGEALVVSQFTLLADCSHGRRPSFINSAPPDIANALYEYFVQGMKDAGVSRVETGEFGADMAVELLNDGPVTILLDSKELH